MELKEIVGYLPHALKALEVARGDFINSDDVKKEVFIGLGDAVNTLFNKRYKIKSCKPILRPMRKLKAKDWVEIFGAGLVNSDDVVESVDVVCSKEFHVRCNLKSKNGKQGELITCTYDKFVRFNEYYTTFNQFKAYEVFYKLHADIHKLIEKDEAIDISCL